LDRFLFSIVPVAFMGLGAALVIRPAAVIALNRDSGEEPRTPTPREILKARILGGVLIAGGAYGLYALLTGMPGAEFFPV
jgi:hypothetical protein